MSRSRMAATRQARQPYHLRSDPLRAGDAYTMREAYASADYTNDGKTRRVYVSIKTFGARDGTYPDTALEIRARRYDLLSGDGPGGSIGDNREQKAETDFVFYADQIEALALALTEAVRVGKEQGVIPTKPYTGPPPPRPENP